MGVVNLVEYIEREGDEAAAALFGVSVRTVASWRLGERTPRRKTAQIIVKRSPVTYAGIYQPSGQPSEEPAHA